MAGKRTVGYQIFIHKSTRTISPPTYQIPIFFSSSFIRIIKLRDNVVTLESFPAQINSHYL